MYLSEMKEWAMFPMWFYKRSDCKGERGRIYLLRFLRYEDACGDDHDRQAGRLSVQYTGRSAEVTGLCETEMRTDPEESGINEMIVRLSEQDG